MKSAKSDPDRERDAEVIACIVELINARRRGDYLRAADAHRELEGKGVLVKFTRKAVAHA